MKKISYLLSAGMLYALCFSCSPSASEQPKEATTNASAQEVESGQSAVKDDESQKDIVKVAIASPDHSTLVKAVQEAELVDVLSNAGPFTVFAPVNSAFDALPAGTVESLLKPENKSKLQDILQHHVYVGVLKLDQLKDGQVLGMVDGTNATISIKDGQYYINDAKIIGTAQASNGIIHVIDKVVLPK